MAKTLILFYSLQGSTKKAAQYLAKELNLPMEEIELKKPFKPNGMAKYIFGGRQAVMGSKPPVRPIKSDLSHFDTIIIGSPVWAGTFAPPIKTLLERGILKQKRILFFYCSGGGPGKTENKIQTSTKAYNSLVSTYSLTRVEEDFNRQQNGLLNWAKKGISLKKYNNKP